MPASARGQSSFRHLFLLAFIILAVFTYTSVHSLLLRTPEDVAAKDIEHTAEVRRQAKFATRKLKEAGRERAHMLAEQLRAHGAVVAQPGGSAAVILAEAQPAAAAEVQPAAAAEAQPAALATRATVVCVASEFRPHTDLDGAVVKQGGVGGLVTKSAAECCDACLALRGCNVWVHSDSDGACWLKRSGDPRAAGSRGSGPNVAWTSGTLLKSFWEPGRALPAADQTLQTVALRTREGDIRLRLKPDWHLPSVDSVRRLASPEMPAGACAQCELYRVEHGFLVQGTLHGVLPPNTETGCRPAPKCQPGPRVMIRGDVGWAGGGAGPDFFIYLGKRPADWLRKDHTVWAEVADDESLALAERIVALPSETPGGPGTMRFLKEKLEVEVVRVGGSL